MTTAIDDYTKADPIEPDVLADLLRRGFGTPSETGQEQPAAANVAADRGLSAEHQLSVLGSGARVVTEEVPSVRSVALGLWVRTGSRDETPAQAGVSHFLEHLLFKGTDRFGTKDYQKEKAELVGERLRFGRAHLAREFLEMARSANVPLLIATLMAGASWGLYRALPQDVFFGVNFHYPDATSGSMTSASSCIE